MPAKRILHISQRPGAIQGLDNQESNVPNMPSGHHTSLSPQQSAVIVKKNSNFPGGVDDSYNKPGSSEYFPTPREKHDPLNMNFHDGQTSPDATDAAIVPEVPLNSSGCMPIHRRGNYGTGSGDGAAVFRKESGDSDNNKVSLLGDYRFPASQPSVTHTGYPNSSANNSPASSSGTDSPGGTPRHSPTSNHRRENYGTEMPLAAVGGDDALKEVEGDDGDNDKTQLLGNTRSFASQSSSIKETVAHIAAAGIILINVGTTGAATLLIGVRVCELIGWGNTVPDIIVKSLLAVPVLGSTGFGKYQLMLPYTKMQIKSIFDSAHSIFAHLTPTQIKAIITQLKEMKKAEVMFGTAKVVADIILYTASAFDAGVWGYAGGATVNAAAESIRGVGSWGDEASNIVGSTAMVGTVAAFVGISNMLMIPSFIKFSMAALKSNGELFYPPTTIEKKSQLLEKSRANLWLEAKVINNLRQLVAAIREGDLGGIEQHMNNTIMGLAELLKSTDQVESRAESSVRRAELQTIIKKLEGFGDQDLKQYISAVAATMMGLNEVDAASALNRERVGALLGVLITALGSPGYFSVFDLAKKVCELLKISPQSPAATKIAQVVSYIMTIMIVYVVVYQYGSLLVRHLTDSALNKGDISLLTKWQKIPIAVAAVIVGVLATAPIVFMAIIAGDITPFILGASVVGAFLLEIRAIHGKVSEIAEKRIEAKLVSRLEELEQPTVSTDASAQQDNVSTAKFFPRLVAQVRRMISL